MKKTAIILILISSLFIIACSQNPRMGDRPFGDQSFEDRPNPNQMERGEMQQAAIDACKDKIEGDTCTITTGEMEATCKLIADKLQCAPQRPDFGGPR